MFVDVSELYLILIFELFYRKNQLQKTGEWLTGQALDDALEEYTRDNPELLKSIDFKDEDIEEMSFEYETLKDLNKMEEDYIESLKDNISNLK